MTEFQISELSISGYAGKAVPNRFFKAQKAAEAGEGLAVLFPGLRYTCDMPLLYYPTKLFLQRGFDVLQVHTDYTRPEFQASSRRDQGIWLAADAKSAVQAGRAQGQYDHLVLVGKSIGTLVLAHLVANESTAGAGAIWLTPLLHQPQLVEAAVRCKGPALFVAGSGDPTFDEAALVRIQEKTRAETMVIEGANHSLEVSEDPLEALGILQSIIQRMAEFLNRNNL
ncbi:MAG TPA: alpha/beta family hydrolase [Anaerolineales bacterium]